MEISQKTRSSLDVIKFNTPTLRLTSELLVKEMNINRPVEVLTLAGCSPIKETKRTKIIRLRSSFSTQTHTVVWVLRPSGRRTTVVSYLFHKWLFGNLSKDERIVFLEFPETVKDPMIFSALKARSKGIPLTVIRRVLLKLSTILFDRKPPTLVRWQGYRSYLLSIEKEIRLSTEVKVKRYTGWKRHQNDHGSIGPHKEDPFLLEPLDENDNISIFLTICNEIKSGSSDIYINNIRVSL